MRYYIIYILIYINDKRYYYTNPRNVVDIQQRPFYANDFKFNQLIFELVFYLFRRHYYKDKM